MSERKNPHLLPFGEYDTPDGEKSVQVWRARMELMRVVARVFPLFLQKLSTHVFPLFELLVSEGSLVESRYNFEKALWSDGPQSNVFDILAPDLKMELRRWAVSL